jgi:ATP-binding cassette subfamily B protein
MKSVVNENRVLGLWRLMSGFRWIYLGAALSLGIAAFARTGTYLWLRHFVDNILGASSALQTLLLAALVFVGIALVQGAFTFLSGSLASRTAEGIARRLRNDLFDHIQRLSFTYHDTTPTGELISRCSSDVDAIRRFFADQAIGFGRIMLLFLVNFIAIFRLNAQLALLSVIAVPIIVLTSYLFFRRISEAYEAYQEQEAVLSTTLQENLSAVRVVKAFSRQSFEIEKFEKDNWEKFQRGRHLLTMHSFFWPVSDTLAGFQTIAGYAIGAIMTMNGDISIGTYLAYVGMLIWIIWPMRTLGRLIVQMSTGLVSFMRVAEVLKERREPMSQGGRIDRNAFHGEVVFQGVSFAYSSGERVLQDISFHAKPGAAIGLLGPTGSGKSSLVNLLPRFYDYTSGSITIDGVELKQLSRNFLRQQIGIVEQEPFLFSRTIRENITYGVDHHVDDEHVETAAEAAAIHEDILRFPEAYNTLVGERGVTLSGGQKQRVAIARALLKDPRILILDDSTSSVDMETEGLIRRALHRLMQGRTTFIIAHRIQSVMNADLIMVLEDGRIVQHGQHHELIQVDGIYRSIYRMQTRMEDELKKEIASASVRI